MNTSSWFLFIANLPGRNQTLRMRVWRSLKASGAGTLRDGVYVLPASDGAREEFERQRREGEGGGGPGVSRELARGAGGERRDTERVPAGAQAERAGAVAAPSEPPG